MWVRRTQEQTKRAAFREGKSWKFHLFIGGLNYLVLAGALYLNLRAGHPDAPQKTILVGSLKGALITAPFVWFFVTILKPWRLFERYLANTTGADLNLRSMLCLKCWSVQPFRRKLVCSKCGGQCEDAANWTWIDDSPEQSSGTMSSSEGTHSAGLESPVAGPTSKTTPVSRAAAQPSAAARAGAMICAVVAMVVVYVGFKDARAIYAITAGILFFSAGYLLMGLDRLSHDTEPDWVEFALWVWVRLFVSVLLVVLLYFCGRGLAHLISSLTAIRY